MREFEVAECLRNLDFVDKTYKTMERYQLYVAVQSNSKNRISLQDIMKLPWDNVFLNETEFEYNEAEAESLKNQADTYIKMMEKGSLVFNQTAI